MNFKKKNIKLNLTPLILIVSGITMAFNNIEGWGWLIFLAVCFIESDDNILDIKLKKDEKDKHI